MNRTKVLAVGFATLAAAAVTVAVIQRARLSDLGGLVERGRAQVEFCKRFESNIAFYANLLEPGSAAGEQHTPVAELEIAAERFFRFDSDEAILKLCLDQAAPAELVNSKRCWGVEHHLKCAVDGVKAVQRLAAFTRE